MKSAYLVLVLAIATTLVALVASFISAPRYGYLFATILVCDLVAVGCFIPLIRLGGGWKLIVLGLSILVLYTAIDIMLRWTLGVRVLDILR